MNREITVVTVLYNSLGLLDDLAETISGLSGLCRVILVDNGSVDGTRDEVRRALPGAHMVETGCNRGFGAGNNVAIDSVTTPFTLLLNSDARLSPESLGELGEVLSREERTAAVQPVLRSWEWPLLCVGRGLTMTRFGEGYDLRFMHLDPVTRKRGLEEEVPGVSAAVSLWRTEALREAGGFDENIFMYFEDVDLCMRLAAAGWKFRLAPGSSALHRAGASSTRREALSWELSSSVYIMRRFFCGGGRILPGYWKRRELRIRLSSIRRGIPWLWRPGAVRRGKALACSPVHLPGELLSELESRPLDLPMPRPGPEESLDDNGLVVSGPGFHRDGTRTFLRGYGCLRIRQPLELDIRLSTPGRTRSGVILDSAGDSLLRFNTRPDQVLPVSIRSSSSIVISLDERDAVAEVLGISTRGL